MDSLSDRARTATQGRFHAFLLAATVPLFLGALLSDYAYWTSHQIEWSNFASWLLAGALVFGGGALLFAVIELMGGARALGLLLLQVATWVVGFINALIHARDAWAVMPTGLVLSVVAAALACVTTWIAFSTLRSGGTP